MKKILMLLSVFSYFCCCPSLLNAKPVLLKFDSKKEIAGYKVALKDLCNNLPSDWSKYNYAVLELKCSTSQRVFVGFTTKTGYNELRIIFYATNGWIKCALPLSYFRDLPAGAFDLAATYNHKRPLSFINLEHGTRRPLEGVDSIGFRINYPINNPSIEIRSFSLSVEDPGDRYLEKNPAVDRFGQWALGNYEGKIHSEKQLKAEWSKEDDSFKASIPFTASKYGGDLTRKTKATGFFRTEKANGKWWLVDPEGYLFLSISANGMSSGGGMAINIVPGVYEGSAPQGFKMPQLGPRFAQIKPYGLWNLYRRFGNNYMEEGDKLIIARMNHWGLNTIGNWSSRTLIRLNAKPFVTMLGGLGLENGILGLPDIYENGYQKQIKESVEKQTSEMRSNPMLIGYFLGNEPAWTHNELRLCDLIMKADDNKPLKVALKKYLQEKGDTPQERKAFVYETFSKYLEITTKAIRDKDPNHLILGIRFGSGIPSDEVLQSCKAFFDVYSFNHYGLCVDPKNMDYIVEKTGLPLFIGEYHFGTADRGLGMSLIQVNSQKERGIAYRYYTEQAFSHPAIIGTSYFQWNDQEILGRMDGENYNIGMIDVTNRPYPYMVKAIQDVASQMYRIHAGETKPFDKLLKRVAIAGQFPDKWE